MNDYPYGVSSRVDAENGAEKLRAKVINNDAGQGEGLALHRMRGVFRSCWRKCSRIDGGDDNQKSMR